ncbi:MAG: polymerase ECF-type sigma factor [Firmicutes bacterium]|nr:polymerase ECF-type sigma factor [Bacillota bacterium]
MSSGDSVRRETFAALFSQMSPRLFRTALGILGNQHDAADALQEAGLKAYRYFDTLESPEAGAAWLTRIVINACYDQGKRRSRAIPTGLEPVAESVAAAPGPEVDLTLVQALQGLPAEQRTTVVLRFFQDLALPQIAQVMHVPVGTVKSRLHTALEKLRVELHEREQEGVR